MDRTFIEDFLNNFDDSQYPENFLRTYEPLECLSSSEVGETFLVKDRQTGEFLVAKCYSDQALLSRTSESDLLRNLHSDRFPAFIAEYQNDGMLCVVREFVDGTPLDRFASENKLTQQQIIAIGVQLCDDISYLHQQTPPIIHRDIKPQNIVINEDGNPRLIDFGSSRVYDETVEEDTVCFGTRHFAAPEQYGFAQTDCRTDIFSLGVLLCWLLTGETDIKTSLPKIENRRLRQIVKKCTAFSPENRYASAIQVKKALLLADGLQQKKTLQWLFGLLSCIVCLSLGFAIGRYTEFSPAFLASPGIKFEEPLIEQAVRQMLNKQEGDPITEDDLLNVTEIYIYGNQTAGSAEEFEAIGEHMVLNDGTVRNGGIQSLNDLDGLKNLRKVSISLQNISDLSPLGNLKRLEQIQLKHNLIEDVSPLANLPLLQELSLFDTHVTDLSALSACTRLKNIDVGLTNITSMESFTGIKNLTNLNARQIPLESLSGIEEYTQLQVIRLTVVEDGNLSPLLELPELKQVYLDESLRGAAGTSLSQAQFQIIYE